MRVVGIAICLGLVAAIGTASAASFTVDSTADLPDAAPGDGLCATAGGACTLRAAFQEAGAGFVPDEIVLPAGAYALTNGALRVLDGLTVLGAGAATTVIDAGGASRVINLSTTSAAPVVLSGVTIRNGVAADGSCGLGALRLPGGGGICALFSGTLELHDSVVEQCSATESGGGAISAGSLVLERTTIRDNGGGPHTNAAIRADTLVLRDSTISGNTVGGIFVPVAGHASLVNATLSGNGATGIRIDGHCFGSSDCPAPGSADLLNVTITGHSEAGIYNRRVYNNTPPPYPNAPTTIANSLLAGNASECTGGLVSNGYNVLQTLVACDVTGDATGNVVGAAPMLGALADNGGPTATHALSATSFASNAANPGPVGSGGFTCPATDQRGIARPIGGRCDIGAVESSCGDGTVDPGEACDDGNGVDGDACPRNCGVPHCGDGIVGPGETCDDANDVAGDCCDACVAAAAGASCATDGDACTDDVCDGSGHCGYVDNVLPCDDGDPCTRGDVCSAGRCVSGPKCGAGDEFPCLTCMAGVGCRAPVDFIGSCVPPRPGGARMAFGDVDDDARDTAAWDWRSSAPVTKADFGQPTQTFGRTYCLTAGGDAGTSIVLKLKDGCDANGCWTETAKGYRYASTRGQSDRVKIVLRAGNSAQITIRSRGTRGTPPRLPLSGPIRSDFFRSGVALRCWDADFGAHVSRNTSSVFKATSD
ncbi:MAG TPA: choice-of-anchor Q domain-containing protein [Candidatus Binatia bacterium]|jgi:CSLREA domain-containing protein|nr:choice-of-anchor Q domain-containing protein [Candidatus Binatia bacterium]